MSKLIFQENNINSIIRREVLTVLREVIDDPDFGLELTEKAKKRLRKAKSSKQKSVSFSEIKKKYYR